MKGLGTRVCRCVPSHCSFYCDHTCPCGDRTSAAFGTAPDERLTLISPLSEDSVTPTIQRSVADPLVPRSLHKLSILPAIRRV